MKRRSDFSREKYIYNACCIILFITKKSLNFGRKMVFYLLAVIYLSFISLGLPDSLFGSAWPVIYPELNVPVSWSGIIFMIISAGTVISSLQSDHLQNVVSAQVKSRLSVAITAFALFYFHCHIRLSCYAFSQYHIWPGGRIGRCGLNNYCTPF